MKPTGSISPQGVPAASSPPGTEPDRELRHTPAHRSWTGSGRVRQVASSPGTQSGLQTGEPSTRQEAENERPCAAGRLVTADSPSRSPEQSDIPEGSLSEGVPSDEDLLEEELMEEAFSEEELSDGSYPENGHSEEEYSGDSLSQEQLPEQEPAAEDPASAEPVQEDIPEKELSGRELSEDAPSPTGELAEKETGTPQAESSEKANVEKERLADSEPIKQEPVKEEGNRDSGEDAGEWLCPQPDCEEFFAEKWELELHKEAHIPTVSVTCSWEGCGRTFARERGLMLHMKQHTDEPLSSRLRKHRAPARFWQSPVVDDTVPLSTKAAQATQATRGNKAPAPGQNLPVKRRKRRTWVRRGVRFFACPYRPCSKKFAHSGAFRAHLQTCTDEKWQQGSDSSDSPDSSSPPPP